LPALVLTLVLMSMASAHVAAMLGDTTPAERGQLSFNPARHIDPVGTLAVPAMLALIGAPVIGWGKGTPINARNFRHPRADSAVVALSGPVVCLFLGAIAAVGLAGFVAAVGEDPATPLLGYAYDVLLRLLLTSCLLAVFNLLPIPGFDGGKIVEALLPRSLADQFAALGQYSLLILIALIMIMPMLSPQLDIIRQVVGPISQAIAQFFLWGAGLAD